jgi:hypothetical protein
MGGANVLPNSRPEADRKRVRKSSEQRTEGGVTRAFAERRGSETRRKGRARPSNARGRAILRPLRAGEGPREHT